MGSKNKLIYIIIIFTLIITTPARSENITFENSDPQNDVYLSISAGSDAPENVTQEKLRYFDAIDIKSGGYVYNKDNKEVDIYLEFYENDIEKETPRLSELFTCQSSVFLVDQASCSLTNNETTGFAITAFIWEENTGKSIRSGFGIGIETNGYIWFRNKNDVLVEQPEISLEENRITFRTSINQEFESLFTQTKISKYGVDFWAYIGFGDDTGAADSLNTEILANRPSPISPNLIWIALGIISIGYIFRKRIFSGLIFLLSYPAKLINESGRSSEKSVTDDGNKRVKITIPSILLHSILFFIIIFFTISIMRGLGILFNTFIAWNGHWFIVIFTAILAQFAFLSYLIKILSDSKTNHNLSISKSKISKGFELLTLFGIVYLITFSIRDEYLVSFPNFINPFYPFVLSFIEIPSAFLDYPIRRDPFLITSIFAVIALFINVYKFFLEQKEQQLKK